MHKTHHTEQESFYISKNFLPNMELTKISSKGQLVIPKEIRKELKLKNGDIFATTSENGMIVLKKIKNPILEKDLKILKKVEEAWQEMEKGNFRKLKKEEFLKELDKW